jgi:hypothetical protein
VTTVEVVHHAFANASFRIAQTYDGSGADLASRNPAWIGNRVSLAHGNSVFSAPPS